MRDAGMRAAGRSAIRFWWAKKLHVEPSFGDLVKVSYQLLEARSGKALAGSSITIPGGGVFAVEANVVEGTVRAKASICL